MKTGENIFMKYIILFALSGIVFCFSGAVTVYTGAPVRPGGVVVSGQAEVMPHSSFSAIDATEKGGYDTLEININRQADAQSGVFKIDYFPHFSEPGIKILFNSALVYLGVSENEIFLQIGNEKFAAPVKLQPRVWYETELQWQNGSISVKIDDKEYISLKRDTLPIGETFFLGGIPDGMIRNISLDRPRPCPVEQLAGAPLKFIIRADNSNFISFDYFARGAAQKLRIKPRMTVAPGDKFFLIHSAGDPMYLSADTAGELIVDLPGSYSNRVEIRRDTGNMLAAADLENFPRNWQVETVDNYRGYTKIINATCPEKPLAPQQTADSAVLSDEIYRSGKSSVILSRNRTIGSIVLSSREIAIKPNTRYLLTVYYKTLEDPQFDGSFILQAKVWENGSVKQTFRQYHPCTPLRQNGKWNLVPLQFNTKKSSLPQTLSVELISDAAPCKIAIDDIDLREYPNNVYQPMPRESDRKRLLTGEKLLEHLKKRQIVDLPSFPMSGVAGYDGNVYKMMARAGADLQFVKVNIDNRRRIPAWRSDGSYDFSAIDEQLLHVLSYAPDARVGIMVGIDPALDFGNVFPDAAWRDIDGRIVYQDPPDARFYPERKGKKYPYVSFTAPDFRRECGKFLFALGKHLQDKPWGKAIAGIHVFGGGDGQWFYRPRKNDLSEMMDRSAGNLAAMQDAIRKYYRNDLNALRKAWGDNDLTFDTITFPDKSDYNKYMYQREPEDPKARKIIDFIKLYPEAITETLAYCVDEFERGIGRKILKSRYYFGTSLGHLLKDSSFDILVSVPPYGVSRLHGAVGRVHQAPASATLHKKIFLNELDLRTSYSPVAVYGTSNSIRWNGVEPGPEGFANMMRKMTAPVITANQGYWYLMIGGNSSMQDEFEPVVKESFDALKSGKGESVDMDGQIAFFWDEEARTLAGDRFGWSLEQHSVHQGQRILFSSGIGVQQYLLNDLTHPERRAAKVNIFALGTTMTEEQISYIEKNLQKDGNVLVFVFDAGRTAPGGFEKNIMRLTGMKIKSLPRTNVLAAYSPMRFSDPLAKFIKTAAPISGGPFAIPLYYVDDPTAKPLAQLVRTDLVGAAVKRHKEWTAVYLSIPLGLAVEPGFIRQLAVEAGIKPFAPPGEISYAGNGIVAIHAVRDGVKKLQWQESADVFDLSTNKIIRRNSKEINVDMKYGETRWFRLLKPRSIWNKIFK